MTIQSVRKTRGQYACYIKGQVKWLIYAEPRSLLPSYGIVSLKTFPHSNLISSHQKHSLKWLLIWNRSNKILNCMKNEFLMKWLPWLPYDRIMHLNLTVHLYARLYNETPLSLSIYRITHKRSIKFKLTYHPSYFLLYIIWASLLLLAHASSRVSPSFSLCFEHKTVFFALEEHAKITYLDEVIIRY